jgi:hypothetical protein
MKDRYIYVKLMSNWKICENSCRWLSYSVKEQSLYATAKSSVILLWKSRFQTKTLSKLIFVLLFKTDHFGCQWQCRAKTEKYISINVALTFQTRYDRACLVSWKLLRGPYYDHYCENYCDELNILLSLVLIRPDGISPRILFP